MDFINLKDELTKINSGNSGRDIIRTNLPTLKALKDFATYLDISKNGNKDQLIERIAYHTFGYKITCDVIRGNKKTHND